MQFQSLYPTEVPDQTAEDLFLVLAHHWTAIPPDELARTFVRSSLYPHELPASFRANVRHSHRYGLLLEGLEGEAGAAEAFVADAERGGRLRFSLAAATSSTALVSVWSRAGLYRRPPMLRLEVLERAYRERVGEEHTKTLARARDGM